MKKLLFVCLFISLFSANAATRGTITVNTPMQLIHTTIFGNEKAINVSPGTRGVKVSTSAGGKLKLDIDGVKKTIKLKLGQSLPSYSGSFTVAAANTGQPYNIAAKVNSNRVNGYSGSSSRSCTYYLTEYICRQVCTSPNYSACNGLQGKQLNRCRRRAEQNISCSNQCGYKDIPHSGIQYFDYTNYTLNKRVSISFRVPLNGATAATAVTASSESGRDTYNMSSCRY